MTATYALFFWVTISDANFLALVAQINASQWYLLYFSIFMLHVQIILKYLNKMHFVTQLMLLIDDLDMKPENANIGTICGVG
jgi:hypothetical protein